MTGNRGHNAVHRSGGGFGAPGARWAAIAVAAGILVVLGIGTALGGALQAGPPAPGGVSANAGATGTVGIVIWEAPAPDVEVAGYRVWRAEADGPFVPVGAVPGGATGFSDTSGLPGEAYRYGVSAMDANGRESQVAAADAVVTATWSLSPHVRLDARTVGSSNSCGTCHRPHGAGTAEALLREGETLTGQSAVCYRCHSETIIAADVGPGSDAFSLFSGHTLEATASGADMTAECGSCHDLHAASSASPMLRPAFLRTSAGTRTVSGPISWCLACHDELGTWYSNAYGAAYPALGTGPRDADGYPISGTWPGAAIYTDETRSPHARIPASASLGRVTGDCLYCHAAHRGANRYDGLRESYRPTSAGTLAEDHSTGAYAAACFVCHGGTSPAGLDVIVTDIKRHAVSTSPNAGHRVRSGGVLPPRAQLPCYDCHDPHGTAGSAYGLLVVTQTGPGATVVLGDAPGEIALSEAAVPADVRAFCLSCHTTSDTSAGWDGSSIGTVAAGALVEGIDRTSQSAFLRLRSNKAHEQADPRSCYECHGRDYSSAGSFNVHDPAVPVVPVDVTGSSDVPAGFDATSVAPVP
ncbi:MAG: hypothetical protein C0418_04175 [Coriobacteriaceae bacterium]|nr:hypothetical protein [Coriobacteriaceae bacterium]